MPKLPLSIALSPYEHALDLLTGRVTAEGVDINWLRVAATGTGDRFTDRHEFDVGEVALADYAARVSNGDHSLVAIPVFLSRRFVQGAVWVRTGGPIKRIGDLGNKDVRCAVEDDTVAAYLRAWLRHESGEDPGKAGPSIETAPDTAAAYGRLAAGEVAAVVSLAGPPSGKVAATARLIADVADAEPAYYKATGVFPILRVLCLQREIAERHRWLATSLFDGFARAKQNSLNRLIFAGMSRYPLPWINAYVMRTRAVFGDDFWPYGIGANRPTLEAFLREAPAQGIVERPLAVEGLFDAATLES